MLPAGSLWQRRDLGEEVVSASVFLDVKHTRVLAEALGEMRCHQCWVVAEIFAILDQRH